MSARILCIFYFYLRNINSAKSVFFLTRSRSVRQGCAVPGRLCRPGGGAGLSGPAGRLRDPTGEPPLPCRGGGQGSQRGR